MGKSRWEIPAVILLFYSLIAGFFRTVLHLPVVMQTIADFCSLFVTRTAGRVIQLAGGQGFADDQRYSCSWASVKSLFYNKILHDLRSPREMKVD